MCGRFVLSVTYQQLAEQFSFRQAQAERSGDLQLSPAWNIAPSTRICAITADQADDRHLVRMKWGLIPSWAKDAHASTGSARAVISGLSNARGETVAEKPSFRSAFKQRRCIIPASGFYEWQTVQGVKQPWYVSLKSGETMAFAGLWETWHARYASKHISEPPLDTATPTRDERDQDEVIVSCCIITTAANALMETIHDRMPAILDREQWATWLSPQVHEADKLLPLIRPHDPQSMQAWPVTREVNRVGLRDDAGLAERVG